MLALPKDYIGVSDIAIQSDRADNGHAGKLIKRFFVRGKHYEMFGEGINRQYMGVKKEFVKEVIAKLSKRNKMGIHLSNNMPQGNIYQQRKNIVST